MVYNKSYYQANREKIRVKYNIRSKQKKRRVLMLAELLRVMCVHQQEPPAKAPVPPPPVSAKRAAAKASKYMFTIDRTPVTVCF
jgi:hypothetical protein